MTHINHSTRRLIVAALTILMLIAAVGGAGAQTPPVNQNDVLYIMPFLSNYPGGEAAAISELRSRLAPNGEGSYVRLGFARFVALKFNDWNVDTTNPAALRAQITGLTDINGLVDMARVGGFPVSLALLNAVKETYDPVQTASEREDIRSMQWYADNTLARGWWSYSRYARKKSVVQQAYFREVAKEVARLMRDYPASLVAASGDGEVELARPVQTGLADQIYADFSPFTVADFRDWVRHAGMYDVGGELAGQGCEIAACPVDYGGDNSPGVDTNGDGRTFNVDFGTSFTTWNLLHFDWSLSDQYLANDPHAIPLTTYTTPGAFSAAMAASTISGGFDAPRAPRPGSRFWDLWVLFKQTLLQHYNIEFAKWMTTTQIPAAGDPSVAADATYSIPRERWYSYQIPADYMFQCDNGCASPNERWYSSMSSWWTADVSPYGSYGITSYAVDWIDPGFRLIARTLPYVAPKIAERNLRWGLIEWHPGVLKLDTGVSTDLSLFTAEMEVVKRYRPNLLQPFIWGQPNSEVMGTPFETALRQLITDIKDGRPARLETDPLPHGTVSTQPLTLTGWAADFNKSPGGGPGIDQVDIYRIPGNGDPAVFVGSATYGVARPVEAGTYGLQYANSGFSLTVPTLPLGSYEFEVRGHSTVTQSFNVTARLTVELVDRIPFVGPPNGGWSGTISGSNLIYNGVAYPIVNGRVDFPDCTTYSVAPSGALFNASATPNCTPGLTTTSIAWANPASVVAGTTLGATQLNASSGGVAGTFAYTPALGTVLNTVGNQTLSVTFTPTDTSAYTTATASVTIVVTAPITPTISWTTPASVAAGTVVGGTQLNATASVPGAFTYNPAAGAVLASGTQTLSTTFTPTDTLNYTTATRSVTIVVAPPVAPVITWANPASVTAGTALGATQLNATANVAGTFAYTPAAGAVLSMGTQTLATTFTPTDTISYTTATRLVTIEVTAGGGSGPSTPTITWASPASVTAGTALGATQLNATANVAGTFVYTPAAGTLLSVGTQTLLTTFTPNDTENYTSATRLVTILVTPALITPTITWATPAAMTVGTALSGAQLNASTGGIAGTFVYTPTLGTVMNTLGSQALSVSFTPTNSATYATATATVQLQVNAVPPFVGPPNGGWSGTISGSNLLYNGGTYPIVNGRVNFPDCTTYIVGPNGSLMGRSDTPNCSTGGGGGGGGGLISPTITWATPAAITQGTPLTTAQLNAVASVAGTYAYNPGLGSVLAAGNQTLSVTFTPADGATYAAVTRTVTLVVTTSGGGSNFVGPPNGGWSGTISGSNLLYNGGTYPIVNGRVNFPDCTTYIVAPNGSLMGRSDTPNCSTGGGGGGGGGLITPTITWATPTAITQGTPLTAAQLNAVASVAGTHAYNPGLGAVLAAGNQTLSVTFTPNDLTAYTTATVTVTLVVTTSGGGSSFVGPPNGGWSGTISGSNLLYNGGTYPIVNGRVNFPDCTTYIVAPNGALMGRSDTPNCSTGGGGGGGLITPTITWATPTAITQGTQLSATQLNAVASVAGTYAYNPGLGAVLAAGNQTLSVTFTPNDLTAYTTATVTVTLVVTTSGGGGFVGPPNGGWSGTISGSNLLYNGGTYPIVNGRVNFPNCTTFIVAPNGALMGGAPTPGCGGGA